MKSGRLHDAGLDTSWKEAHFEVVAAITRSLDSGSPSQKLLDISEKQGTGGLYELAEDLTTEFECLHADRQWDGDFFDEISKFLEQKLS